MKLRVPDLSSDVLALEFEEAPRLLNEALDAAANGAGQRFEAPVAVSIEIYRIGSDLHLSGVLRGEVIGACPRCLGEFQSPVGRKFRFVVVEVAGDDDDSRDDEGIGHYCGEELDLGPVVREQVLLELADRRLCTDSCRGLCSGCGVDLNREACRCGGA